MSQIILTTAILCRGWTRNIFTSTACTVKKVGVDLVSRIWQFELRHFYFGFLIFSKNCLPFCCFTLANFLNFILLSLQGSPYLPNHSHFYGDLLFTALDLLHLFEQASSKLYTSRIYEVKSIIVSKWDSSSILSHFIIYKKSIYYKNTQI